MKEKTVEELKQMMDNQENFQLIDVREEFEHEVADIGGEKIPMGQIPDNVERIAENKPVIIYCRSGNRSGNVCMFLESNFGMENVYNLQGGILAWADRIDHDMPKY